MHTCRPGSNRSLLIENSGEYTHLDMGGCPVLVTEFHQMLVVPAKLMSPTNPLSASPPLSSYGTGLCKCQLVNVMQMLENV